MSRRKAVTFAEHEFTHLKPVYVVVRGDDTYAVPLEELTPDECQAIARRLRSEAWTKSDEADELRRHGIMEMLLRSKTGN